MCGGRAITGVVDVAVGVSAASSAFALGNGYIPRNRGHHGDNAAASRLSLKAVQYFGGHG